MTTTIITTTTITVVSMPLLTTDPLTCSVGHLGNQLKGRSSAKLGPRQGILEQPQ